MKQKAAEGAEFVYLNSSLLPLLPPVHKIEIVMSSKKHKASKVWPGMPTKGSKFFEFAIFLSIPIVALSIALLLWLISLFR